MRKLMLRYDPKTKEISIYGFTGEDDNNETLLYTLPRFFIKYLKKTIEKYHLHSDYLPSPNALPDFNPNVKDDKIDGFQFEITDHPEILLYIIGLYAEYVPSVFLLKNDQERTDFFTLHTQYISKTINGLDDLNLPEPILALKTQYERDSQSATTQPAINSLLSLDLADFKEQVQGTRVDAWVGRFQLGIGNDLADLEKKTLLYHLIEQRDVAKDVQGKIKYLLEQGANCSLVSLMITAVSFINPKNQALAHRIILMLVRYGASPTNTQPDHDSLFVTVRNRVGHGISTPETACLIGILGTISDAEYFNPGEIHKNILLGNIDNLKKEILISPKKVRAADNQGNTPLHYALIKFNQGALNTDIIQLLLESGASVTCKNKFGKTPLYYASYLKDEQNIQQLLQRAKQQTLDKNLRKSCLIEAVIKYPISSNPCLPRITKELNLTEFKILFAKLKENDDLPKENFKTAKNIIFQAFYQKQKSEWRLRLGVTIVAGILFFPSLIVSYFVWRRANAAEAIVSYDIDEQTLNKIKETRRAGKPNLNSSLDEFKNNDAPAVSRAVTLLMTKTKADQYSSIRAKLAPESRPLLIDEDPNVKYKKA